MKFADRAAVILRDKPPEQVAAFLKKCDAINVAQRHDSLKVSYQVATSKEIAANNKALKHMAELQKLSPDITLDGLDEKLETVKTKLTYNWLLKTGSRASDLTLADVYSLLILKFQYKAAFPDSSWQYDGSTIARSAG